MFRFLKMERSQLFVYIVFILNVISISLSSQNKIEYRFSTRTPYRVIENNDLNVGQYPGCEQLKIWMLIRHGTRLPTQKIIDFMINQLPFIRDIIVNNHNSNKGKLTDDEIDSLKKWTLGVKENDLEGMLVTEGEREMFKLGQRTQQRFAKITNIEFDRIKFKTTPTQRAYMSAHYFANGMFGENVSDLNIEKSPDEGDKILRFYKSCDSWQQNVKKNDFTYSELDVYVEMIEMRNALAELSLKMGIDDPIAYNMGKLIYNACAFETAWSLNDTVSPWCALFSNSSIKAFEYAEDLKLFWRDGYGSNLTKKLPCKQLDDIVNLFQSDNTSSVFYFSHSGTILKTLAFFGLYEPIGDLRHYSRDPNRQWQTSRIDAFSSNLAFVLYRCGEHLKFGTFHQERLIHLPECNKEEPLCPMEILLEKNKSIKCDLEEMCSLKAKDEL